MEDQPLGRPQPAPPAGLLWPIVLAVLGAAMLGLAFPPHTWLAGWLAVPALAVMFLAWRRLSPARGALLGLVCGCVFFGMLLSWMGVLGIDAWLLLTLICAVFWVPMGFLLPRLLAANAAFLTVPALWVGIEQLRSVIPWGGFPWGRLAFSQSENILAGWAVLGGVPLVSVLVVCAAMLALRLMDEIAGRGTRRPRRLTLAALLVATLTVLAGAALTGCGLGGPNVRTARVAIVQGNVPRAGLDFNAQRRAVLDNHVRATLELASQVDAGQVPAPEAVIWPENSSDIDPLRNADAARQIDIAAAAIGAPILIGSVLSNPADPDTYDSQGNRRPGTVLNAGMVWDPITGPGQFYVKRHPVPFGEYLPMRSFLSRWVSRFERIPRDFAAGTSPGVLEVGAVPAGVVICFEVAYDNLPRDTVRAGGQILVVQTNNATYARTGQPEQQLAITKLRARETGRATLVAATSGISAAITPAGSTVWEAPEMVAAAVVVDVPLRVGLTPAVRLGPWLDAGAAMAGLAAFAAWVVARRTDRGRT